MDFTELPKIGRFKYLLVLVESFPSVSATVNTVTKVMLKQIIPRYGTVENIDSDQGSHFTSQVLQGLMQTLEINWEFHTPWHPSSSGRVERMKKIIINKQTNKQTKTII